MRKEERYRRLIAYFEQAMPKAESELHYENPFQLLVAVMLSAQCTDKRVNMVTPALFKAYPDAKTMAVASVDEILAYVKSVSYPNSKASHLSGLAKMLVADFGGQVPQTMEELQRLPGVGRKTANVVMNVWYHQPTLAVDTHVMRIAHRLDFSRGKTPLEVEQDLMKVLPKELVVNTNHWLVLFGRYICKAQRPLCDKCPIYTYCHSKDKR